MGMQEIAVVSHSSTIAEVISLNTGLRMEGSLELKLLDTVIDVLESLANRARSDLSRHFRLRNIESHTGMQ